MAENIDVAQADEERPVRGSVLDPLLMRDEEGQLRHEFVEEIARAIAAADRPLLCEVVAELHEADLGDLIGALEAEEFVLADLHEARARFDDITGARPQDEVLRVIFERFCIGK